MIKPSMALIFDIKKFSLEDGPGIRTVLFFKGCNMNCFWCHNPEGILPQKQLIYDSQKCINCGLCTKVCPTNAHFFKNAFHHLDFSKCEQCLKCTEVCPSGALSIVGKEYSLIEIKKELYNDIPYFISSGGGITLSGGEFSLQKEFSLQLLNWCHQNKIHTAIETNFNNEWDSFKLFLPYLDLLFVDIKSIDNLKHKKFTGVDNSLILENIKIFSRSTEIPFVIRTPFLNEVNGSVDELQNILDFINSLDRKPEYYEILKYIPFGIDKAKKIGQCQIQFDIPKTKNIKKILNKINTHKIPIKINGKNIKEET